MTALCIRSLRRITKTAAQRKACSPRDPESVAPCGRVSREEDLLVVLLVMAPPSQELEPPINPARFNLPYRLFPEGY